MSIFDDLKIDLVCPLCDKKQNPTIKQLKSNSYKCTSCGAIFDANDFQKTISDIESQFKKMGFR